MPEIAVGIEIYCAACGEGLCSQTEATRTRTRATPAFRVDPCRKCLEAADEEGYKRGYEEAQEMRAEEDMEEGESAAR